MFDASATLLYPVYSLDAHMVDMASSNTAIHFKRD